MRELARAVVEGAIAERDVEFLVGAGPRQRAIRRLWLSCFETDVETLEAGLRRRVEAWRR